MLRVELFCQRNCRDNSSSEQTNALWVKANWQVPLGILELCLSFYSHPNISDGNFILFLFSYLIAPKYSDIFFEVEINLFWFSFSISLQNVRKEPVEFCQIFHPWNWCTDICKTQFSTFYFFILKTILLSNAIFSSFSRHGPYFHPTKNRCSTRPSSPFFYICCNFGQIFCTKVIQFFLCGKYGTLRTQKEQQI